MSKYSVRRLEQENATPSTGTRLPYLTQERRVTKSVAFPRWILAVVFLIVGFILWTGVLAGASGKLRIPRVDSLFYVAAVVAMTAFIAHADRKRESAGKSCKFKSGDKPRRSTAK